MNFAYRSQFPFPPLPHSLPHFPSIPHPLLRKGQAFHGSQQSKAHQAEAGSFVHIKAYVSSSTVDHII